MNKYRILIVEDEKPMLLGLKTLMKRNGFEVFGAGGGHEGLALAKEILPDIILSDVMMPPPNGFELRELLKQDPATANIPFIFLTARTDKLDKLNGFTVGANDYITKPFDNDELLARVQSLLQLSTAAREEGRVAAENQLGEQMEGFKREILQNFHHEMRTPLVNIMIPLEAAVSEKFDRPDDKTRFLKMAVKNANRLHNLMEDMILLTNIDNGDLNTIRQAVSPSSLKSVLLKQLAQYDDKDLDVKFDFEGEHDIYAPRNEFTRALVHLADNAFKFSPHGGHVDIKLIALGDGSCEIIIKDQGPGIPPHLRKKVFERYYQISQGDMRNFEGLGVGLTIAQTVAKAIGGELVILPYPRGTMVYFRVPHGVDQFQAQVTNYDYQRI